MINISEEEIQQLKNHGDAGGDVLVLAEEMGFPINREMVELLFINYIHIKDYHDQTSVRFRITDPNSMSKMGAAVRKKIREIFTDDAFLGSAIAHQYKNDYKVSNNPRNLKKYPRQMVLLPRWMAIIIQRTDLNKANSVAEIEQFELRQIDEDRKEKAAISVNHY